MQDELMTGGSKQVRDFAWLLRSQLTLLREAWYWYLVQASFVPVSYVLFLWLLTRAHNAQAMDFLITGSVVMSLSFAGMLSLGQNLGYLKDYYAFEYYATLPISKIVFIAALATRGMLLALPSAVIVLVLGAVAFGLRVPLLAVPILLLSAYALSGVGAFIGFWSPTGQVASLVTQILQTIIIFFAPIYYPLAALPGPFRLTAFLFPTTYAAQALRGAVSGQALLSFWPSIAVLAGFALVSLVLVPLRLDWRGR